MLHNKLLYDELTLSFKLYHFIQIHIIHIHIYINLMMFIFAAEGNNW